MLKKLFIIAVAVTFSLPVLAAKATAKKEATPSPEETIDLVKKSVESKLGVKVASVVKSPYLNLYEVFADGQILYTDENTTAFIAGNLIDGKSMRNVTAERMRRLSAIKFTDLPLELAVKQVRGDGKRVIASFEDPNCGYCKKLARDTAKLDNVTIYTFLYPILSPDSLDKSNQVWCSADKAKAWNDWMQDGKALSGRSDCDTSAVQKSVELGHKLAITGTPTLFFADGERIPGAVPMSQIEKKLDQATVSSK